MTEQTSSDEDVRDVITCSGRGGDQEEMDLLVTKLTWCLELLDSDDDNVMARLSTALLSNNKVKLHTLLLHGGLSLQGAEALLPAVRECQTLQSLSIAGSIEPKALKLIPGLFTTSLKRACIHMVGLRCFDAVQLAAALQSHPTLEFVQIGPACLVTDWRSDDDEKPHKQPWVVRNSTRRACGDEAENTTTTTTPVTLCPTTTTQAAVPGPSMDLYLLYAQVDLQAATALGDLLECNRCKIRTLSLSYNDLLGDAQAMQVARGLAQNSHLYCLDLSDCRIATSGAVALARAVKFNTYLAFLDLEGNDDNMQGQRALRAFCDALSANSTLLSLNLPAECRRRHEGTLEGWVRRQFWSKNRSRLDDSATLRKCLAANLFLRCAGPKLLQLQYARLWPHLLKRVANQRPTVLYHILHQQVVPHMDALIGMAREEEERTAKQRELAKKERLSSFLNDGTVAIAATIVTLAVATVVIKTRGCSRRR